MSRIKYYLNTHTNPPVFLVSGVVIVGLVFLASVFPTAFGESANGVKSFITTVFGWWYILIVSAFLIFTIYLAFSRYGSIKLGKDDEEPEWSRWSWFSMLFTAGMGIGLVYYGVAEPVMHFKNPPVGQGQTADAAMEAMNLTYYHWAMHPWAIYIIVGMSVGYFCFRHDLPLRPAAALYPLIGEKGLYGWIGNLVDILAVFGTLFGLATSLGLGAGQINTGLNQLFGLPEGPVEQVFIIAAVTSVAVTSVMLGVDAGIRRLSVINMYLAIALAIVVFVVGPTLFILDFTMGSTGYYVQNLVRTSLRMFTFNEDGSSFMESWTLFYWGWWIAWSPFVGMFIARVSRGRTIREFIAGCLLAPTLASIVWFTIFGGSALHMLLTKVPGAQALLDAGTTDSLFVLLQQLSLPSVIAWLLSLLGVVVVAIFFATSSDSGSLVVDMLTNGGDPDPIWQQRLFWAVLEGVVAAILLLAGAATGGDPLSALQTASVSTGLPFSIVIAFMAWALLRSLRQEPRFQKPEQHWRREVLKDSEVRWAGKARVAPTPSDKA
ncbi:BCCT family transporter [Pararhizobium mangrovi]|uniref:BCCT family transporter n=1 Tax=Pararhizobium mangrovi TaxID=2590452 RepID=A0A506U980_9HYPH|nr:BCCT family transporter [Pararhizobium mangrovi]TPW29634.1 BCCT family transporter [Pararhizobium mangrovi]